MIIISTDIGLSGGISIAFDNKIETYPMPTKKILIKPEIRVFDLDSKGKKQFYKGGDRKGEPKTKVKSKAVYKNELDVIEINNIFNKLYKVSPVTFVFEQPGISAGNAAGATATTNKNYGKLLAIAELSCNHEVDKIVTVAPMKWKKDLSLSKDKLECVVEAEKLTGINFRTPRGSLKDGEAEAFLIGHWYSTKGKYNEKK